MISVCVVSIIGAPQVRDVSLTDPSWSDVDGIIWSIVELNVGVVSACLPALRPLFNYLSKGRSSPDSHVKQDTLSSDSTTIKLRSFHKNWSSRGNKKPTSASHEGPFVRLDNPIDPPHGWDTHFSPEQSGIRGNTDVSYEHSDSEIMKQHGSSSNAITVTRDFNVHRALNADKAVRK